MSTPLDHARALAVAQDFGPEALDLNLRLVAANPNDIASRTRLARCYLQAGRLDDAERQYQEVLRLDARNRIAIGGLEAIDRLRHPAPEPVPRARPERRPRRAAPSAGPRVEHDEPEAPGEPAPQIFTGFGPAVFDELRSCPRPLIVERFAPRVVDFLRRVNVLQPCIEMAALREPGRRQLFRLSRTDLHAYPGHWSVFNQGGRWEPQVNIGMAAGTDAASRWLRIGLGFSMAERGEADAASAEQARAHFRRFQQFLTSPRRSLFLGWMVKEDGRIQVDHGAPRADVREPSQAAAFVVEAKPERIDWLFFGKWLSPARPEDAAILADPVAFVRVVDRVLAGLLPVWRALWE